MSTESDGSPDIIGRVPVFADLNDEGRRALAAGAAERLYGDGELIVR